MQTNTAGRDHSAGFETSRAKLLIIEDNDGCATFLKTVLEGEGCDVIRIRSGECALHALGGLHFDLIVTDLLLPGLHGADLVRSLRANANGAPILVVSSLYDSTTHRDWTEAGAVDGLGKPFSPSELIGKVARVLQARSGWEPGAEKAFATCS